MDGLLRADQRLALARCTATKQLEINPRVTFERKDLRSYLGFESGKDEWKEFDSVLLTQSSLLDQEVTKIYGLMLRSIANNLSDNRGTRLLELFEGIWE